MPPDLQQIPMPKTPETLVLRKLAKVVSERQWRGALRRDYADLRSRDRSMMHLYPADYSGIELRIMAEFSLARAGNFKTTRVHPVQTLPEPMPYSGCLAPPLPAEARSSDTSGLVVIDSISGSADST